MSIVLVYRTTLPSAATLTIAPEVVGEIDAFRPMAMPRPRLHPAGSAVERRVPVHALGDAVQHLVDRRVFHDRAGRVRAAIAQDVAAAEFQRIDAEFARDQVGVAFIGPDQLRNAEAAQRARGRPVGINLGGIDR